MHPELEDPPSSSARMRGVLEEIVEEYHVRNLIFYVAFPEHLGKAILLRHTEREVDEGSVTRMRWEDSSDFGDRRAGFKLWRFIRRTRAVTMCSYRSGSPA